VSIHQQLPVKRNEFLHSLDEDEFENSVDETFLLDSSVSACSLDTSVKTWSDFKGIHYHPRSTVLVPENGDFTRHCSEMEQIEETIRFFAEECDSMQGYHIVSDLRSCFGTLATAVLEYLEDEYKSKTRFSFPTLSVLPPGGATSSPSELLSHVLNMAGTLQLSDLTVPLSVCSDVVKSGRTRTFPHLVYDSAKSYHTSAILACGLESFARSYRRRPMKLTMDDVIQTVTPGSRTLASFNLALPFSHTEDCTDALRDFSDALPWQSLTPGVELGNRDTFHCFSHCATLCGFPQPNSLCAARFDARDCCSRKTDKDFLRFYLQEKLLPDRLDVTLTGEPVKLRQPFPHIFSSAVQPDGRIHLKAPKLENLSFENSDLSSLPDSVALSQVSSVPVLASLESSTAANGLLKQYRTCATSLKRWTSQSCHSDVVSQLVEALERMHTIEEYYFF